MPFFEGNYNITKLKKNVKGEIIQLEINNKNVPLNASDVFAHPAHSRVALGADSLCTLSRHSRNSNPK